MVTLTEAINNKYNNLDECEFPEFMILGSPVKTSTSKKSWIPSRLIMDCQNIESIGSFTCIDQWSNHIRELDLSGNRFSSWKEIHILLKGIPNLEQLNLSHNPFHEASISDLGSPLEHFSSLKSLILNHTHIPWQFLITVLGCFPKLKTLYVSGNHFGRLIDKTSNDTSSNQSFPSIEELYFNHNHLSHWDDVFYLGRLFPNLSHLVLLNNELTDFPSDTTCLNRQEETSPGLLFAQSFPHLGYLALSENPIQNWSTIDALDHLPQLTNLKLLNIDLFHNLDNVTRYSLVVARLPRLIRFNGSFISPKEREDAERTFIRHFMNLPESEHMPRYLELCSQHGPVEPLVDISLAPPTTVNIIIQCFDADGNALMASPSECSLSLESSIGELKDSLCAQFASVLRCSSPKQVRLFYVDQVMAAITGRDEMKYLSRAFHSYQPENGDEMHLELKPSVSSR